MIDGNFIMYGTDLLEEYDVIFRNAKAFTETKFLDPKTLPSYIKEKIEEIRTERLEQFEGDVFLYAVSENDRGMYINFAIGKETK